LDESKSNPLPRPYLALITVRSAFGPRSSRVFSVVRSPHRLLAALGGAAALGLGGCSTTDVLNTLEPKFGQTIARDIAYGDGPRRTLDVYQPRRADGAAPVVVFFYGGNWRSGDKSDYVFAGSALASKGYVVIIPDYRVYPEVRWPAFLQDSAEAVAWARANAARFGGDADRLVLMGHSAGAYNAAMLTIDERWLQAVGVDSKRDVRAMVGLAGPYDFLPLGTEELRTIFGPEEGRPATQPINHVDGGEAPMLLAHDVGDQVVDPGNGDRLAARVRALGGRAETRAYDGLNHQLMVGTLAAPLRFLAPVLKDASAFIDAETREARP